MSMTDGTPFQTTADLTITDPNAAAATDDGLAAPAPTTTDPSLEEGLSFLATAFGKGTDAAQAAESVMAESDGRVREIIGEIVPTKKGRVALLDWLGDDSSSMGYKFFRYLMNGYDMMINMLREEIKHDSVETLVTASLLNQDSPIHGYTPLAKVPELKDYTTTLVGQTHWMKRFGEQLTALSVQAKRYEEMGREVTGVAFLGTDGQDTEITTLLDTYPTTWEQRLAERRDNLVSLIRGYVAAGNISVGVAYMGKLLKPGDPGYASELEDIRSNRHYIGLDSSSRMTQEELIIDLYTQLGFPEDMIFMPGSDMRRLAEVLAAVSRSMVARSRGEKPRNTVSVAERQRY